jgi:hypothetical protein
MEVWKRERRLRDAPIGFPEKDVKGRCFTAADSEIASGLGTCLPVRAVLSGCSRWHSTVSYRIGEPDQLAGLI